MHTHTRIYLSLYLSLSLYIYIYIYRVTEDVIVRRRASKPSAVGRTFCEFCEFRAVVSTHKQLAAHKKLIWYRTAVCAACHHLARQTNMG